MKKTIFKMTMVLFISVIAFSGCKKGEDDPGISFRSRTARLAGNWKLSSMDYTTTNTGNGSTSTAHYTYSGTILSYVYTSNGYTDTQTLMYTNNIEIEKDGTYNQTIIYDGNNNIETGNWLWVRKSKEQDLKKKEAVLFSSTSKTDSDGTSTYSGKTNLGGNAMVIKRLANKEMVFLFDYSHTTSDGKVNNTTGTWTFVQE